MKTTDFKFTLDGDHFVVEAEGKRLRVLVGGDRVSHKVAMMWCKANDGGDETVENLRLLAKHRDQINNKLEELGRTTMICNVWSNEVCFKYTNMAFFVNIHTASVAYFFRDENRYAYAIRELPATEVCNK